MSRSPRQLVAFWMLALLVGGGVFWLTCLTEPALHATLNFGTEYGQMASDPFGLIGKFPHRILSPLVANLLGLGGDRYWLFAHGCTVLLIAMWFAAARLLGARWWQALLLTLVLGFTGAVQLFKGHVGYPDPVTFLLLTATIVAVDRPRLFWLLQFCSVMHHEQILFFWPWLLYWRHQTARRTQFPREGAATVRWRDDLIGGAIVAGLYVAWRYYVGLHARDQVLTMQHYSALDYFPVGTVGLVALNLLSTYIWFGLLPLLVAWHGFRDGWRRAGIGILLFIACQHAVFGVAHDVYRFTCFLFVPVLFAGLRLLRQRFGALILLLIGGASGAAIKLQAPVFVEIGTAVLVEQTPNGLAVRADPVHTIVPEVIPAYWGTFAAYGVCLIATLWLGWFWARRSRQQEPSEGPADALPGSPAS